MTAAELIIGIARTLELGMTGWQERVVRRAFAESTPLPTAPVFPHALAPGHPLYLSSLSPAGRARSAPLPLDVRLALRLGRDQSAWARSVRWSCGRPGYVPVFEWRSEFDRMFRAEYARAFLASQILRADRLAFVRISAV